MERLQDGCEDLSTRWLYSGEYNKTSGLIVARELLTLLNNIPEGIAIRLRKQEKQP